MRWFSVSLVGVMFVFGGVGQVGAAPGFVFRDFSDVTELNMVGSAQEFQGRLRLTPTVRYAAGAAWFNTRQIVEDGFRTNFRFQLSGGGDGFTFAIQNDSLAALGAVGGSLGYAASSSGNQGGIPASLVIEFDSYLNREHDDPNGNHVSVHTAGLDENLAHITSSLGWGVPDFLLDDGNVHTATIEYLPESLSVWLDGSIDPVVTVPVNLANTLPLDSGQAWVGFTASTGGATQTHDILSWNFAVIPEPSTLILLGMGTVGLLMATWCRAIWGSELNGTAG